MDADPDRLTTVFDHLIRNALDAARKNGRIMFETDLTNGVANVSISDIGEGISLDFIREQSF